MRMVILLVGVAILAGCASAPVGSGPDEKYMARVELGARMGGARVYWVNPPEAHPEAQQTAPQS